MLAEKLLACLACPACGGGPLRLDTERSAEETIVEGSLGCPECKRWYRVVDDIPRLLPPGLASNLRAGDEHWSEWREAMLDFLQWREDAWSDEQAAAERRSAALALHEQFLEFCALPDGPFDCLDIGAAAGQLSDLIGGDCTYVGIDPLPGGRAPGGDLPPHMPRASRPVSLVQAVGEVLPFARSSFDVVLMLGSLDHTCRPDEAIAEAARVLRDGGTLCILQGKSSRRSCGIGGALRSVVSGIGGGRKVSARDTHLHRFGLKELEALVSERVVVAACSEEADRIFLRAISQSPEA